VYNTIGHASREITLSFAFELDAGFMPAIAREIEALRTAV
jgi:hypothetical protein